MSPRDRIFPVLTALLAGACVVGGDRTADHVGSMNAARLIGALMAGSATRVEQPAQFPRRLFPGMSGPVTPTPRRDEPDRQQIDLLKKQIATVEVVLHVWRRVMWGVGGTLAALAVLAAATTKVRLFHLLGVVVVLLSTAVTMTGMWLIISPAHGAMPPLAWQTWVCVGLVNGLYAPVLLVAFWRRSGAAVAQITW